MTPHCGEMWPIEAYEIELSSSHCDPNEFYNSSLTAKVKEWTDTFEDDFSYATGAFLLLTSPVLIFIPFLVAKLRTLTRQIISMVVVADLINALAGVVSNLGQDYFGWVDGQEETNIVCITSGFLINASYLWSVLW